jgi:ribonucleoside-diphosphate reductase alpha chain
MGAGMTHVTNINSQMTYSGGADMLDAVQLEGRHQVRMDRSRDALLTDFGRATLDDRYLMPGEGYQDLFARVASYYGDDAGHAQRIYDYMSRLWFMPATPVLSNGGTKRGLPISCFLNEATDSLDGIVGLWNENVWLASKGGGIGSYWGNLRSIGEKVGAVGKTSGVIPFIRVMDSLTLAISQGSLRRGSAAVYLPVSHPEIEEFIEIRRPTGGDPNRKALNLHHGILIPDAFMRAVEADEPWVLTSPKDGAHVRSISARGLWIRILTARIETGEPYLIFSDTVNANRPEHQKLAGLEVKTSNLCSEITLPTGIDKDGQQRTAVCCLSSLNLENWMEWKDHPLFIEDIMRFLDNVLQDFIDRAPAGMERAKYSAMRERSVGLGVMGFHSFLQSQNVPFESVIAKVWNMKMFRHIRGQADAASNRHLQQLLAERGQDSDEVWSSITLNKGSVQNLDFLTEQEKAVYKTALEMDQRWIVEHAADRTPFVCQSQSVNLFLPANVHKRDLHQIHFLAWKRGMKSLYYCRSLSIARADNVSDKAIRPEEFTGIPTSGFDPIPLPVSGGSTTDYEECLSCQ